MTEAEFRDLVEQRIDHYGLNVVLSEIATICHEKVEHLRSNWQDERTAEVWESAARCLDSASDKVVNIFKGRA